MTSGRSWTIVALALAASIAANLFLGGVLLGRHLFRSEPRAVEAAVRRFLATVPEEARPLVRARMREHRDELVGELRAVAEARRHVGEVLERPELDDAALAAALARVRASTATLQERVHGILTETMKELPPGVRTEWGQHWGRRGPLRAWRARRSADRAGQGASR
jgi:uncharacterized membrane protein